IVKTSTEDLAYLFPGQDAADAAAQLLDRGPACVVVTDGAAPVRAFAGGEQVRADVPAAPVVDTVGAGDAFAGAFVTWWSGDGMLLAYGARRLLAERRFSLSLAIVACWSSARCWRSACWPRCSGPGPNAAAGCPG